MNSNHKTIKNTLNKTTQLGKSNRYLILTTYKNTTANTLQQLKLRTHSYAKLQLIKTTVTNILTAHTDIPLIKHTTLACYTNTPLKSLKQLLKQTHIKIVTILFKNQQLTPTQIQKLQQLKSKTDCFTQITLLLKSIIITLTKLLKKIKNENNKTN
ncbi:50S ribosomal protein L10 [Candidatus Vidania fulgoroideae]|uniref:Large ribosomal subunit protein uL10 n=1 Tax=Candidatus Vidania fulgoroideorum TaxID=881286 RepID=A0A974X8Z8_9PROT|nr:50S ribosomal protein L10 [Candidatus Vidania fulgoroideae]